jgi:hypothetical protein
LLVAVGIRVDLDVVDEDRVWLLAIDRQVDEGVGPRLAPEELEVVGIDRDRRRGNAIAVDDRREFAGSAQHGDLLADDLAGRGGKGRAGVAGGGGHSGGPRSG